LLLSAGVRRLVVATGYRGEAVRRALADSDAEVTFCHNEDFERTQNSVSLFRCRDALDGSAFFKLDGDLLFHPEVMARLEADRGALSAAIDASGTLGEEEMKVITDGARILRFGKKLAPARCSGESIGIEKISASASTLLFAALDESIGRGQTDLYYEDVYAELIPRGLDARAVDVSDLGWMEIDTPDDLVAARRAMASGRLDRS
jgi:choline kinase